MATKFVSIKSILFYCVVVGDLVVDPEKSKLVEEADIADDGNIE